MLWRFDGLVNVSLCCGIGPEPLAGVRYLVPGLGHHNLLFYASSPSSKNSWPLSSMSSVIACHNLGFEIVGSELDADYFKAGVERVKKAMSQQRLFE
jgi:hypothetical protein